MLLDDRGPCGVAGSIVRERSLRRTVAALPFISLWVIGFIAFIAIPIVLVLYWSFTNYNLFSAPQWVGLANYQTLIADPTFWKSVWNTAYLALLGIPTGLVMGLGTAMLLNRPVARAGLLSLGRVSAGDRPAGRSRARVRLDPQPELRAAQCDPVGLRHPTDRVVERSRRGRRSPS